MAHIRFQIRQTRLLNSSLLGLFGRGRPVVGLHVGGLDPHLLHKLMLNQVHEGVAEEPVYVPGEELNRDR